MDKLLDMQCGPIRYNTMGRSKGLHMWDTFELEQFPDRVKRRTGLKYHCEVGIAEMKARVLFPVSMAHTTSSASQGATEKKFCQVIVNEDIAQHTGQER